MTRPRRTVQLAPAVPRPACSVCTTPHRCGAPALGDKGPRCAGRANGPDDCDCLNACGDDPWLKAGRSAPCADYVASAAAAQLRRDERLRLLSDLVAARLIFESDRAALLARHTKPGAAGIDAFEQPDAAFAVGGYATAIRAITQAHELLSRGVA